MNEVRPFAPMYQRSRQFDGFVGRLLPSVTVAAVDATAVPSAAFPGPSSNAGHIQIQISNKTNVWVHINFGIVGAVVAATLTDYPVPPSSTVVVTVDSEVTGASVFANGAPGGSTSVIFTRGAGVGV